MGSIAMAPGWFIDDQGRRLLLRGLNVGGSSKVPRFPDGSTELRGGLTDHRSVSFVGRPFPLDEAGEHFRRISSWGFSIVRLLVTWEAIEHAGPGRFDEAFLDYLVGLVAIAGEHRIEIIIDPHQDAWSRFCGGDGAPGWTHELVGMDLSTLDECGAAVTHQKRGDPFPRMIWPTNRAKLAAATMYTLFYGGSDFASRLRIDGRSAQEFFQERYIAAFVEVARRLSGRANLLGFDSGNEPYAGYIGVTDLTRAPGDPRIGAVPTFYESMVLGEGYPRRVDMWRLTPFGSLRVGHMMVNERGVRAWREGRGCVWREEGVWDVDHGGSPRLLRADYFGSRDGREVNFARDYLNPFVRRFAAAIRSKVERALIFAEGEPGGPMVTWPGAVSAKVASAPHWYDGMVLMLGRYSVWLGADYRTRRLLVGPGRIRRSYAEQLRALKREGEEATGGAPTLIGETGTPLSMDSGRRLERGGESRAGRALDRTLCAMEDALISFVVWNYTADNDADHGDHWNGENLSVFTVSGPRPGGRAVDALVRPYAMATPGTPTLMRFDLRSRRFELEFTNDPLISAPAAIFVPTLHYPTGIAVELSDGSWEQADDRQLLFYRPDPAQPRHRIIVRPA